MPTVTAEPKCDLCRKELAPWDERQCDTCRRRIEQATLFRREYMRIPIRFAKAENPGWDYKCFSWLIHGPVGVGKSHAAYGLLQSFIGDPRNRIATFNCPALFADLKASYNLPAEQWERRVALGERFTAAIHADVLLLDDIGVERTTSLNIGWISEHMYLIFNQRWENNAPTIVTCNCSPEELARRLGERVMSRLFGLCKVRAITGDDRREHRPNVHP